MATETLQCEAGHNFTRERTRGRKPRFCAEHAPVVVAPVKRVKVERAVEPSTETLRCEAGHSFTRERARGRKPRFCPEHLPTADERIAAPKAIDPRVLIVLENPATNDELRRKLDYCNRKITSGRYSESDVTFTKETQTRILREAEKLGYV